MNERNFISDSCFFLLRRVMVILNIDVKIPGAEVGRKIGEPTQQEGGQQNGDAAPPPQAASPRANPRNFGKPDERKIYLHQNSISMIELFPLYRSSAAAAATFSSERNTLRR